MLEQLSNFFNSMNLFFSIPIAIGALIYAWYVEKKNQDIRAERYRFSWNDVEKGSALLAKQLKRQKPDLIVTFSGPGAVIANLAMVLSGRMIPLYTVLDIRVISPSKPAKMGESVELCGYEEITSSRRRLMFPCALKENQHQKIFLVDDCTITGEGLEIAIKYLLEAGYQRDQIISFCMVVSKIVLENPQKDRKPDYYWESVKNDSYFFPWSERF